MNQLPFPESLQSLRSRLAVGSGVWVAGWIGLVLFDGALDLGALGMLLVLIASVASVWLPLPVTLCIALFAVTAFNWMFVPPRGSFAIDVEQDSVLLLVMFALCSIVAGAMSVLRAQVRAAQRQAHAADTLRAWTERLRDADDPRVCAGQLQQMLQGLSQTPVVVMLLRSGLPRDDTMSAVDIVGTADAEQYAGLWYCLRNGHVLGPRSGRYETLAHVYVPIRGRDMTYGAALVGANLAGETDAAMHTQDLCNRMGTALERHHLQREQAASRQAAHEQELRATLLTAIAHEYRTPLATIMGAASALERQGVRLDHDQRQQLARRIVNEAAHLRQMTGNILQLARLDAPGLQLRCDWESAEELIGSLAQRHADGRQLAAEVETGLPLLWCDSLLLTQLLDNLVDNALKYGVAATPVHIGARRDGDAVALYVRDHGPGIPATLRESIFQPFTQGQILPALAASPQGVGIGLALCRVIATAHGGVLHLDSSPAGSCFTCLLPLRAQPELPHDDKVDEAAA